MDITEFEKQMPPKAKRSRLEPFLQQIFELKDKGYANWQIQKFLEDNGVKVSQESVRKFIKSREGHTAPPGEKAAAPAPQAVATKAAPAPQADAEMDASEHQHVATGLKPKKAMEKKAQQYIKSSIGDASVDSLINPKKES